MKRKNIFALTLAMVLLLTACGGGRDSAGTASAPSADMKTEAMEMPASSTNYSMAPGYTYDSALPMAMEPESPQQENSVYQNSDAKLIRRAELSIQTTEFDQAVSALDDLVNGHGGYYENASVYAGSYRNAHANRRGEYIIRIPAERYEEFRSSTGELGYVVHSSQSSENVGERYYDTEAKLKTQRTKQERLLKLLEQAGTMEDIISLENALSDVEFQIEQMSSTLNRYDSLIGYATFTIYLEEVAQVTEEVGETHSLGKRMSAGFSASLTGLVNGAQNLLVWFSYNIFALVILAAVLAAGGLAAVRLVKKAGARRKAREE